MNDVIGYIRVIKPRYALQCQQEAMAENGITRIVVDESKDDRRRSDMVRLVRTGTVVAIRHLFLLARPGSGRSDLWKAFDAIEDRGGVVWELYSGLKTNDKAQRDQMMRDAVEVLAKGRHKRSAADKRGRPSKAFTDAEMRQAHAAWNSRKLKTWAQVQENLPEGFSLNRAFKLWGPRE